jgi:TolB protein
MRTICLSLWVVTGNAVAALTIEITQGMEGALPIAISPFGWQGATTPPVDIAGIVTADLRRSGRFAPLAEADLISRPVEAEQVRFQDWRMLGVDNLVIGKVSPTGADQYLVQFQLFDIFRSQQIMAYNIPADRNDMRRVAHHISDLIYEKLTGEPGAFNTRIAYITTEGTGAAKSYNLEVADSDGYNPQRILHSKQPVMSPAWSPDGKRLAYVSFENNDSEIYVQEVETGARRKVAGYAGINGAPAWSPDGRRLALTLSRDGNPEIYTLDLASGQLRRLTTNAAIDTEPVWAPNGRDLVFTSDRGGAPQLYRIPVGGGRVERLTFEGKYNAGADFSPDGKKIAMVHGANGRYQVAVLDLDTHVFRVLTDGRLDESPSFSPNGSMIIYATSEGNRGVLAAVSVDGRFRQRLSLTAGNVREPAWAPAAN